jgi:hypothetical protein
MTLLEECFRVIYKENSKFTNIQKLKQQMG